MSMRMNDKGVDRYRNEKKLCEFLRVMKKSDIKISTLNAKLCGEIIHNGQAAYSKCGRAGKVSWG